MTNVIQDAYVLQTRQAIFMRLSRIADEKFIPVLDVAIDEIASRDAEVAANDQLIAEQNRLNKERQEWALKNAETIRELKEQVKILRDALEKASNTLADERLWSAVTICEKALDATEPKE